LDLDLPTYASCIAGIIEVNNHAQLICWDGVLLLFCSQWPPSLILLISTSKVAMITGVSHHIWLLSSFIITFKEMAPGPWERHF
jgi:hypothetical protein